MILKNYFVEDEAEASGRPEADMSEQSALEAQEEEEKAQEQPQICQICMEVLSVQHFSRRD